MAVRIAIRPRLTLPEAPRLAKRRRFRLPPLALPAVGYWLAMGALTYAFARLGPHPLDAVEAAAAEPTSAGPARDVEVSPPVAPAALPATEPPAEVSAAASAEVAPAPVPTDAAALVAAEPPEPAGDATGRHSLHSRGVGDPAPSEPSAASARGREPAPAGDASWFHDFSDSSRPARAARAADGPRIDSLFERDRSGAADKDAPAEAKPADPGPAEPAPAAPVAVSSCEAAIARNNEQLTIGAARGPADITREAYAAILQNGRYLAGCSIPARSVFEICAAVRDGHAVGITVVSTPASPALNACVRGAVMRLKFPVNSRLDVTHTRFEASSSSSLSP